MEASTWKQFFGEWPAVLPRRGVVITSFGEQIIFSGFLTSEAFLLVERSTPDSSGARVVVLRYESVEAVKIIDVVKPSTFRQMGFSGSLPKR